MLQMALTPLVVVIFGTWIQDIALTTLFIKTYQPHLPYITRLITHLLGLAPQTSRQPWFRHLDPPCLLATLPALLVTIWFLSVNFPLLPD